MPISLHSALVLREMPTRPASVATSSKYECDPRFRPLESPSSCVCARDATDIAPNAGFDFWNNPRFAVLGAEGDVIMKRCVGVRHGSLLFQSSLRDEHSMVRKPGLERPG